MNRKNFEIKSFVNVLRHEWGDSWGLLAVFAFLCILQVLVYELVVNLHFEDDYDMIIALNFFDGVLNIVIVGGLLFLPSRMSSNMYDKRKCINFLSLPATDCEKYVSREVLYVIAPLAIAFVSTLSRDLIFAGDKFCLSDYWVANSLAYSGAVCCVSLFKLGSVFFKKFQFAKTFVIIACIVALLSIFNERIYYWALECSLAYSLIVVGLTVAVVIACTLASYKLYEKVSVSKFK